MLKTDDKIERIVRKSRRRAKIIIREEQRREIETGRKKSGDTEQTIASTCNRYNNPEYINKPNILIQELNKMISNMLFIFIHHPSYHQIAPTLLKYLAISSYFGNDGFFNTNE